MTFAIQRAPLDAAAIAEDLRDDAHGALVTFCGVVRANGDDGRRVVALEYEAFEPLALAEFRAVAEEVRARLGDVRLAIVHRVGTLAVGETAVVVAAASAHRREAFDACAYAIDEVKRRAPIWKKERYADGAGVWLANCAHERSA